MIVLVDVVSLYNFSCLMEVFCCDSLWYAKLRPYVNLQIESSLEKYAVLDERKPHPGDFLFKGSPV